MGAQIPQSPSKPALDTSLKAKALGRESLGQRKTSSVVYSEQGVGFIKGDWSVQSLSARGQVTKRYAQLKALPRVSQWDITQMGHLDSVGAQMLFNVWGGQLPANLNASPAQRDLLNKVASGQNNNPLPNPPINWTRWLESIGQGTYVALVHGRALAALLGQILIDFMAFVGAPRYGPWREISAQIFRAGTQAVGITALVGFLIGVVLSYLSGQQLAMFGAGHFIVNLLGVAVVRELGPVLAAIIVAGRSGSAITAQIGVMRVTQELDAMTVMGIAPSQRLILPRVIALALVMPLLILWTNTLALIGGMYAAKFDLGISPQWFISQLPTAIGITNYWIGCIKGLVFGAWIALVACHFGLRIEPNTESLGKGTTASVVTAITGVILIDALFAVLLDELGY